MSPAAGRLRRARQHRRQKGKFLAGFGVLNWGRGSGVAGRGGSSGQEQRVERCRISLADHLGIRVRAGEPSRLAGHRGSAHLRECDLSLLDELTNVTKYSWVPSDAVPGEVTGRWPKTIVPITARSASQAMVHFADSVTEMTVVQHAHQRGRTAQKAFE